MKICIVFCDAAWFDGRLFRKDVQISAGHVPEMDRRLLAGSRNRRSVTGMRRTGIRRYCGKRLKV